MDLERDGKAAGERMNAFYKSKGIKLMPYIEVFYGSECVDQEVVPPRGIELLEQRIGAQVDRLRAAASKKGRADLDLLERLIREAARRERPGKGKSPRPEEIAKAAYASPSSSKRKRSGLEAFLARGAEAAARPWQARLQGQSRGAPRRGAPLRGATGGRRKGKR